MAKVYGVAPPPKPKIPFRPVRELEGQHSGAVSVVRFNANGNYCMTGGHDRRVVLWNPHKAADESCHITSYTGAHGYHVLDIQIASDSAHFASCGGDRNVFWWDVKTSQVVQKYWGHTARVNCLALNADGSVLVSGSYDKTVRFYDNRSKSKEATQALTGFKDSVSAVDIHEAELLVGSVDGTAQLYDLRMGKRTIDLIGEPVTNVCFSNDGNCLLVSTTDNTIKLMDKSTGQMLNEYTGHTNSQFKIEAAFSNDDGYVFSGSENNDVCIWTLTDAKIVHRLVGHRMAVTSLSVHPKEVSLLTASLDGTVRLWDNKTEPAT